MADELQRDPSHIDYTELLTNMGSQLDRALNPDGRRIGYIFVMWPIDKIKDDPQAFNYMSNQGHETTKVVVGHVAQRLEKQLPSTTEHVNGKDS